MTTLPATNLFPPRLCVEGFHGKEYLSIVYTPGPSPDMDWNRRYCDLSPDQASLSLEELNRLFLAGQLPIKPKAWDRELAAWIIKRDELVKRLDRIIKESNFPPEAEEAKAYWERLMGRSYGT
jgi:hypothetical protein